jgi:hypothetical protein
MDVGCQVVKNLTLRKIERDFLAGTLILISLCVSVPRKAGYWIELVRTLKDIANSMRTESKPQLARPYPRLSL